MGKSSVLHIQTHRRPGHIWYLYVDQVIKLNFDLETFPQNSFIKKSNFRFDLDFRVWVKEMDWYVYWYCMYVTMMAMIFEMIVCIIGILGVITVSKFNS